MHWETFTQKKRLGKNVRQQDTDAKTKQEAQKYQKIGRIIYRFDRLNFSLFFTWANGQYHSGDLETNHRFFAHEQ